MQSEHGIFGGSSGYLSETWNLQGTNIGFPCFVSTIIKCTTRA